MVFVMKHNIKYPFYILSVTFVFTFLLTMSGPLMFQSQSPVYATSQQEQEKDQIENSQTTPDIEETETNTGNTNSEQREGSSGEDENNEENPIKSEIGCIAVATNDPDYVYCNTPQSIDQPQQKQTTQQPAQQNTQLNPSQNTFASPRIDSDSSSISNLPNTESTIMIPKQKAFNTFGQYKPGSGQTELTIPQKYDSLARPYTPGGGNPQVEGIPNQPSTNPQIPLNPGNVPTSIPVKGYVTVITKVLGFYNGIQASNFEVCVDSTIIKDGKEHNTDASPPCTYGSGLGTKYTVQAPGNLDIAVKNLRPVSYMVEHPLSMDIAAYESKTITIYITPYPSQ